MLLGVNAQTQEKVITYTVYHWRCPDCNRAQNRDYEPTHEEELPCSGCYDRRLEKRLRDEHKHLEGATVIGIKPYYDPCSEDVLEMIDYLLVRGGDGKQYKLVVEDGIILSVPVK